MSCTWTFGRGIIASNSSMRSWHCRFIWSIWHVNYKKSFYVHPHQSWSRFEWSSFTVGSGMFGHFLTGKWRMQDCRVRHRQSRSGCGCVSFHPRNFNNDVMVVWSSNCSPSPILLAWLTIYKRWISVCGGYTFRTHCNVASHVLGLSDQRLANDKNHHTNSDTSKFL